MTLTTLDLENVTRLETINHTKCDTCFGGGVIRGVERSYECPVCNGLGRIGRTVVFNDPSKSVELSLQDDGRTLKIFIEKRG